MPRAIWDARDRVFPVHCLCTSLSSLSEVLLLETLTPSSMHLGSSRSYQHYMQAFTSQLVSSCICTSGWRSFMNSSIRSLGNVGWTTDMGSGHFANGGPWRQEGAGCEPEGNHWRSLSLEETRGWLSSAVKPSPGKDSISLPLLIWYLYLSIFLFFPVALFSRLFLVLPPTLSTSAFLFSCFLWVFALYT